MILTHFLSLCAHLSLHFSHFPRSSHTRTRSPSRLWTAVSDSHRQRKPELPFCRGKMARRQRQNPVRIASPLLPSPPESSPPHRRAGAVKPQKRDIKRLHAKRGRHNLSQQVSRKQAIHIRRLSARLIQAFLHRLALQFTLRLLHDFFPNVGSGSTRSKNLPAVPRLPSAPRSMPPM